MRLLCAYALAKVNNINRHICNAYCSAQADVDGNSRICYIGGYRKEQLESDGQQPSDKALPIETTNCVLNHDTR